MAGIRTRARGYALQVLYGIDLNEEETQNALSGQREHFDAKMPVEGEKFAANLVSMVQNNSDAIDDTLQLASKNWRLDRMSAVDRNIMRLATAELLYDEEIPTKVVINEAIELAKRYSTLESAAFVNGILDRVASEARGTK